MKKNRQSFIFQRDTEHLKQILVPRYATKASVKKDDAGYWLNVHWNCGVIDALTVQETEQALGETT